MIENVSTQLTVFHCFAHCLLPGRAFASLYALLFLEKEAEIGGRVFNREKAPYNVYIDVMHLLTLFLRLLLRGFIKRPFLTITAFIKNDLLDGRF